MIHTCAERKRGYGCMYAQLHQNVTLESMIRQSGWNHGILLADALRICTARKMVKCVLQYAAEMHQAKYYAKQVFAVSTSM